MKIISLFVGLLLAFTVFADLPYQPRFTWVAPTEFTDTSPLDPLTDLSEYKLYCTGPTSVDMSLPNTDVQFEAPVGMFTAGDYQCEMTAVATASNGGGESAPSAPVNFTISQKNPRPVVTFGVN